MVMLNEILGVYRLEGFCYNDRKMSLNLKGGIAYEVYEDAGLRK